MTRQEAHKTLQRLAAGRAVRLAVEQWGKGLSSPERRDAGRIEFDRVAAEYEAAKSEYERIIREHPELQRLAALRKTLYAEKERLNHERYYHKFEAWQGSGGIGWQYGCDGDTWAEVIAKAQERWK